MTDENPFNLLNAECPIDPEEPTHKAPPDEGASPASSSTEAVPPCTYEPAEGGGIFGGAGAYDKATPHVGPPDVGTELRRLPWDKGDHLKAPPASFDRFCCLNGPCKWYGELHIDEPDALPFPRVRLIRLCRRYRDDEGGTLEMSEGTVTACMEYAPPWWSVDGWRMKLIVARRLSQALERISFVGANPVWAWLEQKRIIPKEKSYGVK